MIVVTGGAGYIGRHVCRAFGSRDVVALDDLRGSSRAALGSIPLIRAELATAEVDWSQVTAVVHCAAYIDVGQSVREPAMYWQNNLGAPAQFFAKARGKDVVFSSTAAVYGEPEKLPIQEDNPKNPTNPYGRSKLATEQMLKDYGVNLTVLRYFNAAGDDEDHRNETHLIPAIVRAAIHGEPLRVFGDGSAIRDFVHVDDLARAHVLALGKPGTYNLGSGHGWTVLEVIEVARRVTGRKIDVNFGPPRPGDPRALVADSTRARRELGWEPTHTLEEMIDSTYRWRLAHPDGYGKEEPAEHSVAGFMSGC
ncbi:MAG: UDP-glucose 4-epimerase GalE [Planctomycetaceae bacterium]|nr:UDP-glucose 4-epimerase GalE [Planctomycetaceae bacterium]